jgi:hypothetical protein
MSRNVYCPIIVLLPSLPAASSAFSVDLIKLADKHRILIVVTFIDAVPQVMLDLGVF